MKIAIVHQDPQIRSSLRSSLEMTGQHLDISLFVTLNQLASSLRSREKFEIIFLERSVNMTEAAESADLIRLVATKKPDALIAVENGESIIDSAFVTQLLVIGYHSVVCPPFNGHSMNELLKVTKLTKSGDSSIRLHVVSQLVASQQFQGELPEKNNLPMNHVTEVKQKAEEVSKSVGVTLSEYLKDVAGKIKNSTTEERLLLSQPKNFPPQLAPKIPDVVLNTVSSEPPKEGELGYQGPSIAVRRIIEREKQKAAEKNKTA
jgi:DNA-binding NarL/FixJ family response regulator